MDAEAACLLDGSLLVDAGAMDALRAHAIEEHPKECIGFIDRLGCYVPLVNKADNPEKHALPDKRIIAREMKAGNLRALCHSHPGGPDCPSESDMRAQYEMAVPFIIVSSNGEATTRPFAWGDELLDDADLIGRPFRHAVTDCYALIRLWYARERGVILPNYPRNWEWWLDDTPGEKDLYRRYFADAGFYRIEPSEVREGDVWLAAVRSAVPNHAGIYLDGGLALHHPSSGLPHDPGRLSKREPVARWMPYIRGGGDHWLRRD